MPRVSEMFAVNGEQAGFARNEQNQENLYIVHTMSIQCSCNIFAMSLQCPCSVLAMFLQCQRKTLIASDKPATIAEVKTS
jgi:hypothetical protein